MLIWEGRVDMASTIQHHEGCLLREQVLNTPRYDLGYYMYVISFRIGLYFRADH